MESDEDIDNWLIDEMQDYNILIPSSMRASILDAAKNQISGMHVAMTGDIDGTEYKLYSAEGAPSTESDQHIGVYITATKN